MPKCQNSPASHIQHPLTQIKQVWIFLLTVQNYADFQDNHQGGDDPNNLSNTHCNDDSEIMISIIIGNPLSLIDIMAPPPPQPLVGKDNDYLGCHIYALRDG